MDGGGGGEVVGGECPRRKGANTSDDTSVTGVTGEKRRGGAVRRVVSDPTKTNNAPACSR